ncbi:MAG TPA: hypothetical protein VGK89_14540 [Candidatus Eisenbacteria bacterium]
MRRLTLVGVCAWLVGLVAYEGWLRIVWRESMGADRGAVMFSSAIAFGIALPVVYAPAMWALRKILGGHRPVGWFPLVAAPLGFVPAAIVVAAQGGTPRDLLSAEAGAFYVMFACAGAVFGAGYALGREPVAGTGGHS